VTLRLPEPNQSDRDGLASDLTHPLSLSDANTARVAIRPGYPTPTQCSCHRRIHGVLGNPAHEKGRCQEGVQLDVAPGR